MPAGNLCGESGPPLNVVLLAPSRRMFATYMSTCAGIGYGADRGGAKGFESSPDTPISCSASTYDGSSTSYGKGQSEKFALDASAKKPGTSRPGFRSFARCIAVTSWKSTAVKRGVFMSACDHAPPTHFGSTFTSGWTTAAWAASMRKVRGSRSGNGVMKFRTAYLSSSLLCNVGLSGPRASRRGNGFGPASRTSTDLPAAVRTCAAAPPPAPLPITQTSNRVSDRFPRTSSWCAISTRLRGRRWSRR